MTLDGAHPDLADEQAYVDHAYACMALMLADTKQLKPHGLDIFELAAFERFKHTRIGALSDTSSALVFGRIDDAMGERSYVGRQHIREDDYETVVLDWRAPAAERFYRASREDPMGLRRRRHFLAEGRIVLGIADDDMSRRSATEASPPESGVLQAELRRQRGGRMRDVVATIQAEQDAIIRSPLEGVVVVQGGPGTGKTAVGLHRAAYLLYRHRRRLERQGILVVGPNPVFIEFVSQVLPSLGEWAMTQIPVNDLAPLVRSRVHEPLEAARLKGDVRMAAVVRRALAQQRGVVKGDVALEVDRVRFFVPAHEVQSDADDIASREAPWSAGRDLLRDRFLQRAYDAYARAVPEGRITLAYEPVASAVRRQRAFGVALDRAWPATSPVRLLRDLYRSPSRLSAASEGILAPAERRLLRRGRGEGEGHWTVADRPLLDEAQALIEGPPPRYGHVVVDEAQDLSPMQLRMLARRCPQASMTVLGDLAQATGGWAHAGWDTVVEHLPGDRRVEELTLGYRVCSRIMDLAAQILRVAAPSLRPPVAVRAELGEVAFQLVESQWQAASELGPAAASFAAVEALAKGAAAAVRHLVEECASCAVIVPDDIADDVEVALGDAGVAFARADTRGLGEDVALVPASGCKGLEFDGVVIVEPSRIVEQGGLRLLYVAVTRAMRVLRIVHSDALPDVLVPS